MARANSSPKPSPKPAPTPNPPIQARPHLENISQRSGTHSPTKAAVPTAQRQHLSNPINLGEPRGPGKPPTGGRGGIKGKV
jgi:hypothetical protein